MEIFIQIFIIIVLSIAIGYWSASIGRGFLLGFILSVLLTPIIGALIILILKCFPYNRKNNIKQPNSGWISATLQSIKKHNHNKIMRAKERSNEKPKCPRCNSEYVIIGKADNDPIAGCLLAVIFLPLIIFSNNTKTQGRCGNCGYKWIIKL